VNSKPTWRSAPYTSDDGTLSVGRENALSAQSNATHVCVSRLPSSCAAPKWRRSSFRLDLLVAGLALAGPALHAHGPMAPQVTSKKALAD